MSLTPHPNPSKTTRVAYLCLAVGLGLLVSFLAHAGIEAVYLRWADANGVRIHWYNGCALHPILQVGLLLAGAVGGFFLGRVWWRIVYVERRGWRSLRKR